MTTTGSSSSQPGRDLPLIKCPKCLVPVVKRLSKHNNYYYKCPKCGEWWFEDAYEAYLRSNHAHQLASSLGAVEVVQQPAVQGAELDLKMVALDLKLLLCDLKTQVKELKEMKEGKSPIVVFMVVFLAVLVALVWKK